MLIYGGRRSVIKRGQFLHHEKENMGREAWKLFHFFPVLRTGIYYGKQGNKKMKLLIFFF